MRKVTFIIFSIFLLLSPDLLYAQATQKADTLTEISALRPIDHILNKSGWNFASVDMYTFWLSNGLYGNYGSQPQIMLDGLPVDVNFFGWQSLNMLPVYLPDLNKVVANPDAGQYSSTFNPAGFIDFENNSPDTGWSAKTGVYLGNETGDPGPRVYDSTQVTPNVDRWGPDAGGVISFGKNRWYAKGIFMLRRHQQTDPISNRRIHRTMRELGSTRFYPIQTNSQSSLFESGYLSDSWRFKVRGILAEDRNYVFLQPFGREVPAETDYRQLAIDSKYKSKNWKFNLRYTLDDKEINRRNSEHTYVFDWNELNNNYTGSVAYINGNLEVVSTINIDHKNIKAPGLLKQNFSISSLHWEADWFIDENNHFSISGGLDIHQEQTAKTFAAAYSREILKHWKIIANTFYDEILPIRQQSFGYWITQGYNFYEELGISIQQPLTITDNRLISFRLHNIIDAAENLSITFSSQVTKHYDLNIPWHMVNYHPETGTTPGTFTISQQEGSRISIQGELNHSPLNWLAHSFSMDFQSTLQGSQRYIEYFRQIPATKMIYQIGITPVKNLSLNLLGIYRSSTKWTEFEDLDGEEYRDIDNLFPIFTGTYDSTVPAHLNIEMGARKWFWEKRLSLQFTIKNLLNNEVRMHPIGADQSLMFNIKAVTDF